MTNRSPFVLSILFTVALGAACGPTTPPPDPEHRGEIETWRADRLERLTASDGWLTLVGLEWLNEGDNDFGCGEGADIMLPALDCPDRLGVLRLRNGKVTLKTEAAGAVVIDGQPIDGERELKSDEDEGGPDILRIGRVAAHIVARGDRMALRIRDPEARTRLDFEGLENFPIDRKFRVTARLDAYPFAREVAIPTATGTEDIVFCPGPLLFEIDGRSFSLSPWVSELGQNKLFIVFTDETSGTSTYGAGRFLSATLTDEGTTVLDFNKAFTPPCGFTPFATCPLAPPENHLDIAVEAGEQLVHR